MITPDHLIGPEAATDVFWTGPEANLTIEMWEREMAKAVVTNARTATWIKEQCGPTVGVFGSARGPDRAVEAHERYGHIADEIGKRLGEEGFALITGGCPGMPQRVEVGVRNHRVSARFQPVLGIRIVLGDAQSFEPDSPTCDAMFKTSEFSPRVGLMEHATEGGIFFSGGWGSLFELSKFGQIEQLRKLMGDSGRGGPIILVGVEFWAGLLGFTEEMCQRWNTLTEGEIKIIVTDDPEVVINTLKAHNGNELRAARIKQGQSPGPLNLRRIA